MSSTIEEGYASSATVEIAVIQPPGGWVVEVQDETGTQRVPLTREETVVGTAPSADVVVRDPTVSSRHCALCVLGAGVTIKDLSSRNGTFVGSARVREAWGRAGTAISIGRCTLIIGQTDPREPASPPGNPLAGVAGASLVMRRLADQVRRLSCHALPVLISGESGTGKELVARAIHEEGPRKSKPFIAINVTALPRELVESELFGHERGAFTGAHARRVGAFAEAEGGTLFLDEVGDLPLDAQPKLLRALDGYEIRRVGAAGSGKRGDVRVVAATHAPLEERVAAGQFRRDLFHRLECFVVNVPPLHARRGDIAAIARELMSQLVSQVGPRAMAPAAFARLAAHDWPGNVRELRNVLCRAADATCRGATIDGDDIDRALRHDRSRRVSGLSTQGAQALLREHTGNLSAAARAAGMPRTSFRKLLES
ncbi:MAG: sigma 54-interacting transcriptional regulator [Myxococcota bacterium]|nr:sigma 54-interacting transcriptional regulator [Myxococcota bacterium]